MLLNKKDLNSERQRDIKATRHKIHLKKGKGSYREQLYCAGRKSQEVPSEHKHKQLESGGVVKPPQLKYASLIALFSRTDETI